MIMKVIVTVVVNKIYIIILGICQVLTNIY
jgi:hypothetical protein